MSPSLAWEHVHCAPRLLTLALIPPPGCSYLTCKVFSSLPGSQAIVSAAEPPSFLQKRLARDMKSWETLAAAPWHALRPGVGCPTGFDLWLVPPCVSPSSRSPGLRFSDLTFSLSYRGFGGPSDDQTEKPEGSSCHFCRQGSRCWKTQRGFGSLPLTPPPPHPPPPFMLMRGSLWGNGHRWLHRPLKQTEWPESRPLSEEGRMCGPDWGLWARSSRSGWVSCLG